MDSSEVRQLVERYYDPEDVKKTVIEIARTPAPQTELYDREPLILKALRDFYRPALEEAGCEVVMDDYGNVIGRQGDGQKGKKKLMFLGYAQKWCDGTMKNPNSGEVMDGAKFGAEGEVVWGRDGSEYTGSNAAAINTARIINESEVKIPGEIIYVISSGGHSSSSDPVYHLLHNDQIKADWAVTLGRPQISLGNTGRLDLRVNIRGKSVHSGGELSAGINAIEGGLIAIERLKKIMPFSSNRKKDPEMGQGRLSLIGLCSYPPSPGFHEGVGSGGHTLQNLMRVLLDRRLVPGEDVDEAIQEIENAIGDLNPWKVTYERGALQYPTKHSKDSPVMRSIAEAHRAMLNREPEYVYMNETIDAGYMNMMNIPTVMYGSCDMRFAHGDTDICQLNLVHNIAKVYPYWAIMNTQ
jgi:acetylornithine deacetylase/succinyl-diaminopimelate desuccinylase-like protein